MTELLHSAYLSQMLRYKRYLFFVANVRPLSGFLRLKYVTLAFTSLPYFAIYYRIFIYLFIYYKFIYLFNIIYLFIIIYYSHYRILRHYRMFFPALKQVNGK